MRSHFRESEQQHKSNIHRGQHLFIDNLIFRAADIISEEVIPCVALFLLALNICPRHSYASLSPVRHRRPVSSLLHQIPGDCLITAFLILLPILYWFEVIHAVVSISFALNLSACFILTLMSLFFFVDSFPHFSTLLRKVHHCLRRPKSSLLHFIT